ncbi:FCD domain-containing protein [Paracoccus onubensis]|uniref:FadR/GntR family transcriptional regulator n=1 Tax=Paracoccus onubensis TaxID=1675788 RepID=UPI002730019B|nr:FCD domain-containing protein [Paracoccus onubensis]MDP0926670.1 FCD domain-containing protein [Paracoccus onubensis]
MPDVTGKRFSSAQPDADPHQATLVQLRAWLANQDLAAGERLPPERELGDVLGVSRGELRKALAALEAEGQLWRHVGKGTFIGARPMNVLNLSEIGRITNPAEVMRTRLLIEPLIAREAALHATQAHLDALHVCVSRTHSATSWRQYEAADNELHRLVAEATENRLLLALFDALNAVRRTVVWGMLRAGNQKPPPNHHSFEEHDRLIGAIERRDLDAAGKAMFHHLQVVQQKMVTPAMPEA